MLEYLRFPVEASRGRRYPEPGHAYRNPFQRDRDRIIHTRAFRRLENKTQVFSPALSDHFRNRLTHTLEVTQIARTIASALGLNEDLTEALALVHDVGHPPFAHAGEDELDRQIRKFGARFDHNIQSLRIVESLEQRYPRFPGLNLTFEVREGIVKHSRDFEPGEIPELDEYLPGQRPVLEAQIIDLADEIAYNAADLDDAYEAEFLTPELVAESVPLYAEILDVVDTQFPGASPRERFQESVRHLIDELVSGLIQGSVAAVKDSGVSDFEAVRHYPTRLIRFTRPIAETSAALKRCLFENVYASDILAEDRRQSTVLLCRTFEYLIEHPEKVPGFEGSGRFLPRAVCDFISGMTDRYFLRYYENLFGS